MGSNLALCLLFFFFSLVEIFLSSHKISVPNGIHYVCVGVFTTDDHFRIAIHYVYNANYSGIADIFLASSPGSPIFFNACVEKDQGAWGQGQYFSTLDAGVLKNLNN